MKKRQSGDRKQTKKSNILRFNVIKWNGLDPSALPCLDFSADSGLFKKPKKACSHLYETAARWYHAWISDFLPATLQQLPPWITGHGVPIYTVHWKNPKKKVSRAEQWKTPGLVDYCILHLYFTCIRPCPCQQLRRSSSQAQLAMLINIEFSLENFLTSWHHVDTCWDLSLDMFSM